MVFLGGCCFFVASSQPQMLVKDTWVSGVSGTLDAVFRRLDGHLRLEKLPVDWGRIFFRVVQMHNKPFSQATSNMMFCHMHPQFSFARSFQELKKCASLLKTPCQHTLLVPSKTIYVDKHLTQKIPVQIDWFVMSVCNFMFFQTWHESTNGAFLKRFWPLHHPFFLEKLRHQLVGGFNPLEKKMIVKLGINSPRWNGVKIPKIFETTT